MHEREEVARNGEPEIERILAQLTATQPPDKREPIGVYIFGTGEGGTALQQYIQTQKDITGRQFIIKGFFDNEKAKHGEKIAGVSVTAPQVQLVGDNDYVFIASLSYSYEMTQQLMEAGLDESRIIPPGDYLGELLLINSSNSRFSPKNQKNERHFQRMLAGLSNRASGKISIFIFGTGQGGQAFLRHFREVESDSGNRLIIKGFLDNNRVKQGTCYENIPILAPGNVRLEENDVVIIASDKFHDEMQEQLLDMGIPEAKIILPGQWLHEILGTGEAEGELIYVNCEKPRLQLYNQTIKPYKQLVFPKIDKPDVSIIIPVHNQFEYTWGCLLAISENTADIDYEVIIADDLSSDETAHIEKNVANVKVIHNTTNLGFLRNCNNAARQAAGKYIVFLNNDTNVQRDWLTSLVDLMERDEKVGMVGSKLVYPTGKLQEAGGIIWRDGSGWNYGRLDDPEKPPYNYVKEVDYISGAAIMIKAGLWREIGGFDERFCPAYYEDTDLAFEVRRRGYKVLYQPKSVVVHYEGVSHGTNIKTGIKSYQVENKAKFVEKWAKVLHDEQQPSSDCVFWARDRSSGKKTMLVCDHHIPYYDQDAGGRLTYHYLKLFVDLGLHVIFLGDHYKREPYTSELEQMGIEVLYGPWYKHGFTQWLQTYGKYLDYVYLNRPQVAEKYIDDIKTFSKAKIIYFGHDLHYLREYRQYEVEKKPELLETSIKSQKLEFDLFAKADVIHVISSYEKEVLAKDIKNKPIRHIPGYIFCDDEQDIQSPNKYFDETENIMFVGGFNHKPNVDAMVWFTQAIFPLITETIPGVKFYIIGSNPPYSIRKLRSENIVVTGYISDEELGQYYRTIRLVVAPLRYGAGVKGKIIEALYNRTPVITTTIGAEGVPGIENLVSIADDAEKFAAAVCRMYKDKSMWTAQMEAAAPFICRNFSKKLAKQILLLDIDLKSAEHSCNTPRKA